ncbi:MAG: alkaline phosphatase family protein [Planctomycetota bacterium]
MFLFLFLLALYVAQLVNRLTRYRGTMHQVPPKEFAGITLCATFILLLLLFYKTDTEPALSWTNYVSKPEKLPPPLLVIGIDGLTLENLKYSLQKEYLPHFQALLGKGSLIRLSGFEGDQASEWISLLTGYSTVIHGVTGLEQIQYPGSIKPLGPEKLWAYFFPFFRHSAFITTQHRRVKFLWEIASEAGFSVTAVNCWGTWPAEALQGTIFSDRCLPAYTLNQFLGQEIFPETALSQIQSLLDNIKSENATHPENLAKASYFVDQGTQEILNFALESSPQLAVAYFQGFDILQQKLEHLDLQKAENLEKKLALQLKYYHFLDALIAQYQSKYRIILLNGPGFLPQSEGFMIAYGEGFIGKEASESFSVLQVMPTLLRALGLPRSQNMLEEIPIFEPRFLQQFPAQEIESFGRLVPLFKKIPSPSHLEEYYRSLGYL